MATEPVQLDPFTQIVTVNWGVSLALFIRMQASDWSRPTLTIRLSGLNETFNVATAFVRPSLGLGAPPVVQASMPGAEVNSAPSQVLAASSSFARYAFWRYFQLNAEQPYSPPLPTEGGVVDPEDELRRGDPVYQNQAWMIGNLSKCFPSNPATKQPVENGRIDFTSSAASDRTGGNAIAQIVRVKVNKDLRINGDFQINISPLPKERINVFDGDVLSEASVGFNQNGGERFITVNMKTLTLEPDFED